LLTGFPGGNGQRANKRACGAQLHMKGSGSGTRNEALKRSFRIESGKTIGVDKV
jgi:hypothetical protein